MRPCIAELVRSGVYTQGSNSLAALAVDNEVSGKRCFQCSTIESEGWCLGERCIIYLNRGGGSGDSRRASSPLTGVRGRKPPAREIDPNGVAVAHLISAGSGWPIPKRRDKYSKRGELGVGR